tara:strand:- start:64276 stop:64596 length:321 start_codon:yes stop_codon:yes gene_type:complete
MLGLPVIVFSILAWLGTQFLTSRIGNPYSGETAIRLVEEMKDRGAIFPNEDDVIFLLHSAIYREVQQTGDAQAFAYLITGLNGLVLVVFGVWPSRKRPLAVLDKGE